jgi:hypothetical protein
MLPILGSEIWAEAWKAGPAKRASSKTQFFISSNEWGKNRKPQGAVLGCLRGPDAGKLRRWPGRLFLIIDYRATSHDRRRSSIGWAAGPYGTHGPVYPQLTACMQENILQKAGLILTQAAATIF